MKINSDLLDFIKGDKFDTVITLSNVDKDKYKIIKEVSKEPICYLYSSYENNALARTYALIGAFNYKTGNPLYLDCRNAANFIEYTDDEISEVNNIEALIYEEIKDKVVNKLDKIVSKMDLEEEKNKYKKFVEINVVRLINLNKIPDYKEKFHFYFYIRESLNKEMINGYYSNKDEYLKELINKYAEDEKENYIEYIAKKKAYEEIVSDYQKDELLNKKNTLYNDFLMNSKYQSFNIVYENADGNTFIKPIKIKDYSDSSYSIPNKTAIYEENMFCGVPIRAIKAINWHRKSIYEDKEFKALKDFEEELNNDFIKLRQYNCVSKEKFSDKDFMLNLIEKDSVAIKYLDSELLNDDEYFKKIFEIIKSNLHYYGSDFPKYIMDNKIFFEKFIDEYSLNHSEQKRGIEDWSLDFTSLSNEKIKKLLKISNSRSITKILMQIPEEILNSNELCDFIKEENIKASSYDFIDRFTNKNTLKSLYSNNEILKYYNSLNESLKEDLFFAKELLEESNTSLPIYTIRDIYNLLKEDRTIIYPLARRCQLCDCNDFLRLIEIDTKDDDKMFELISENIYFLKGLESDTMRYREFLLTLICSAENIYLNEKNNICFDSDYTKINIIEYTDDYNEKLKFDYVDNNNHVVSININKEDPIIEEILLDLNERYPGNHTENFSDVSNLLTNNKDKDIEER